MDLDDEELKDTKSLNRETADELNIKLLRVELNLDCCDDSFSIDINYGKIFDYKQLKTKDLKNKITNIKNKIVNVIKEELNGDGINE